MIAQPKYIFVDLDNTLILADYYFFHVPKDYSIISLEGRHGEEKYHGQLRIGAKELLQQLHNIAPTFLLTAAAGDYARAWNKVFDLGFKDSDIYSRDDTLSGGSLYKPKGNCYLIDDLPEDNHKSQVKIKFLSTIGPVNYIQIKSYNGRVTQSLTASDIKSIVDQIV